ncbi:MAG: HAD-IIIC family phosphatase [Burkholderiales bacterium]
MNDVSATSENIAIAATFVAEPVEQSLAFWLRTLGMESRVAFGPYNQIFQELLDPSSLLSRNQRGVNVLLVRVEDWRDAGSSAAELENNAHEFIRVLTAAASRSTVMHLVFLCPSSPRSEALCKTAEDLIASQLRTISGLHVVPSSELAAAYPVDAYYDEHADRIGHIPFTPPFFSVLGTSIARKLHALKNGGRYKVIAVDGDQTLWDGICGEDGALGIRIDTARKAIQVFMVAQHKMGMLICLCSRNNEDDVAAVFDRRRDEMPLARAHFAGWRVNWKPKSDNIKSLAKELNLGLDSMVFIDDDPVVCAEVRAHCPEVLTLQLPQPPDANPRFLNHLWLFDRTADGGGERTAYYQHAKQREELRLASSTFEDFLAGLRLDINISPFAPQDLSRIAELTQRTNQFNFTTIRRNEAELQTLCRPGQAECFVVRVKDRFGDYGLVGVIILDARPENAFRIDTFLLSCRALGRGVEYKMLAALAEMVMRRGKCWIDVPFVQTPKNPPALDFLEHAAMQCKAQQTASNFRFAAECAAKLDFGDFVAQPSGLAHEAPPSGETTAAGVPSAAQKASLYSSIALELCDAERIHAAISSQTHERPPLETAYVAPRTDDEEQIARIFSELLGVKQIGIRDNFFDLGGHSFQVVRMLTEIENAYGRRLSVAALFQAPTVEGIARILTAGDSVDDSDVIVPLNPHGTTPPLFSVWMGIATELRELCGRLGSEQRLYGINSHWEPKQIEKMRITRIEEMAAYYLTHLRKVQPHGPFYLSSDCLATLIALEMAQQLLAQGEEVAALILIDPLPLSTGMKTPTLGNRYRDRVERQLRSLTDLNVIQQFTHLSVRALNALWGRIALRVCLAAGLPLPGPLLSRYVYNVHHRAKDNYVPKAYAGKVWFIWATDDMGEAERGEIQNAWSELAPQAMHRMVPGLHVDLFKEPYVSPLAEQMKTCLAEARTAPHPGVESDAAEGRRANAAG